MRMLDLFAGRLGWSRAFMDRGWQIVAVDLVLPPVIPDGVLYLQLDVLKFGYLPGGGLVYCNDAGDIHELGHFDFICASSPCEEFSVHGMRHFHPNPKYPEMGIKLFNHTRALCEASGVPYVMENVRPAHLFVGNAVSHCGPFYLWGTGVPPILPQGIKKGMRLGTGYSEGCGVPNGTRFRYMTPEQKRAARKTDPMISAASSSEARRLATAAAATIPPELAGAVADYATRLCEVTA